MMSVEVPPEVTHEELEAAFPWVCHLPTAAIGEFLCAIEIYRDAAEIYRAEIYRSRHRSTGEAAGVAAHDLGTECERMDGALSQEAHVT